MSYEILKDSGNLLVHLAVWLSCFTIQNLAEDFFKEVSSAHQGCIYQIKNTVKTVMLWNIIITI